MKRLYIRLLVCFCIVMLLSRTTPHTLASGLKSLRRLYLHARAYTPGDRYIIPASNETVAFETYFYNILKCHEMQQFKPVMRQLEAQGRLLGFQFLRHQNGDQYFTVIQERKRPRGSGFYLLAKWTSMPAKAVMIQAPHARSDDHTGSLALYLFRKLKATAFFSSTMRRNAPSAPPKKPDEPNPADPAHYPVSFFQAATKAFYYRHPDTLTIQVHGFKQVSGEPDRNFDMIIATGREINQESIIHKHLKNLFKEAFPNLKVGFYGENTSTFGALTNVQGRFINTQTSGVFLHIEISDILRRKLISNKKFKRQFADALRKVVSGYETF